MISKKHLTLLDRYDTNINIREGDCYIAFNEVMEINSSHPYNGMRLIDCPDLIYKVDWRKMVNESE